MKSWSADGGKRSKTARRTRPETELHYCSTYIGLQQGGVYLMNIAHIVMIRRHEQVIERWARRYRHEPAGASVYQSIDLAFKCIFADAS